MKKPTSLLWFAMLLAGIVAVVVLGGCRNPFISPRPAPPAYGPTGREPGVPPPSTGTGDTGVQMVQTVTAYITALKDGKYAAAYDMLSNGSQTLHTRAAFEQKGKKGMPLYDFRTAKATVTGDTAMVEIRQLEDPATHGFSLVREGGSWRVVYRGGIPGAPTPER